MSESLLTHPSDIAGRRASEETRVLATELRRAQIADAVARITRVHLLEQHQSSCFMQPEDLLVLERTQRGHGLEALVKRRGAHVDGGRHFIDRDRLRKMRADPAHGLADALHARLGLADLRHSWTDPRTQQTNDDLVDDERSEHFCFFRVGHQVEQPRHRIDETVGRVADVEPPHVRRLANAAWIHPRGQLGDAPGSRSKMKPR